MKHIIHSTTTYNCLIVWYCFFWHWIRPIGPASDSRTNKCSVWQGKHWQMQWENKRMDLNFWHILTLKYHWNVGKIDSLCLGRYNLVYIIYLILYLFKWEIVWKWDFLCLGYNCFCAWTRKLWYRRFPRVNSFFYINLLERSNRVKWPSKEVGI